ncbi:MAG: YifB family Mg chelatase-like AAA ATPase [Clostridiales bacterium]|nr:YifB family Mg chelatase-like AAA ATPase [Candidatus Apopatousia equi]
MLSKIKSYGLVGLEGYLVDVEIDINNGLPGFDTVGLPDAAVKESKERVKSAIKNSGYEYPIYKIIVNLAPANTKKEGPIYDLAIAVGLLSATEQIAVHNPDDYVILGELSLNGEIRKVDGLLPMLISAREQGYKKFIIPFDNAKEASFIDGIEIYACKKLTDVVEFLKGELKLDKLQTSSYETIIENAKVINDFSFVKGQKQAKRAMEIAAAGGHNVIMMGPPGSGKTMLAKSFPSILPDMTFEEALEVTKIHSVAGKLDHNQGIIVNRPFRAPHHTTTVITLTGGGNKAKPGEISLAHNGVLFLDELPEYPRQVVETLRQPLEDGSITVARLNQSVEYPASFTLIASMNPCPCGYYGSKTHECKCSASQIHSYLSKLSGPLMDRIDLHVEVDSVEYNDLSKDTVEESSAVIKERVNKARKIQIERFKGTTIHNNAEMTPALVKKYCKIDTACDNLLRHAFEKFNLTARAHDRILKVARTIADLDGSEEITAEHILEAINYRSLDRKFWI